MSVSALEHHRNITGSRALLCSFQVLVSCSAVSVSGIKLLHSFASFVKKVRMIVTKEEFID